MQGEVERISYAELKDTVARIANTLKQVLTAKIVLRRAISILLLSLYRTEVRTKYRLF